MLSRRQFITGVPAALGTISFAPAAMADEAQSTRINMGEELVRHVDWFLHGQNGTTPESLQETVGADSWNVEAIAAAFATSWDHLRGSEAAQQIIDDYRNNDGKRFYDALIKPNGRINQSVPRFVNEMFNVNAQRAFNNNNTSGRDYEAVHDTSFQAFLLNAQDGGVSPEDFGIIKNIVEQVWQDGFDSFLEETLIPEFEQAPEPTVQGPAPLNFGNGN